MNKKLLLWILGVILLVVVGLVFYVYFIQRDGGFVVGWVKYTSPTAQTITLEKEDGSEFTLLLSKKTKLLDDKNKITDFAAFTAGTKIEARGSTPQYPTDSLDASQVKIILP